MDDSMEQDILNFIIDHEYAGYIGVRIDKCLSEIMDDYSRAYIQKLIDDGNITCDGKVLKSN